METAVCRNNTWRTPRNKCTCGSGAWRTPRSECGCGSNAWRTPRSECGCGSNAWRTPRSECGCGSNAWRTPRSECGCGADAWRAFQTECKAETREGITCETRAFPAEQCSDGCGTSEPAAETRENACACQTGARNDCILSGKSLASVYSPFQEFHQLYDPREGLCRGTVFCELNKPFCAYGRGK